MAKYPIKMLKDEEGTPFVPLVSTEALRTPEGETIEEKLEKKLEASNIIAGTDITLSVDGNNITINNASKGVLIDNLTTEQSGVGSLDAHQGKVLKDMIPDVINNLTTTSTDKALSAYQGYLLNHKVVPTGGTTGQVLKKSSNDDHALEWGDAADPNAIIGDGSIKKIVELTYEEYQALETIDPDTEYHIIDAQSAIDNLQATLDSLQEQITLLKNNYSPLMTTPQTTSGNTKISWLQLAYNDKWQLYLKGNTDGEDKNFYINLLDSPSSDDTGWIKLDLINGATNFTQGRDLAYRKIGKVVYLSGLITAPATNEILPIAQLPVGCRPHYNYESFVIRNGAGYCKAGINKSDDGYIWIQNSVAGETSFSNVSFIADR